MRMKKLLYLMLVLVALTLPASAYAGKAFVVSGTKDKSSSSISKWDKERFPDPPPSYGGANSGSINFDCFSKIDTNARAYCKNRDCYVFQDKISYAMCLRESNAPFKRNYYDIPKFIEYIDTIKKCSNSGLSGKALSACTSCEKFFNDTNARRDWLLYAYRDFYWNCILNYFE